MTPLRILVMTVVHHPLDTRILVRQIAALVEAGHHVTYAAPFGVTGIESVPDVTMIDLPRSSGRRRLAAFRAARRTLRSSVGAHDVVLIHDPELLLAAAGLRECVVVWDVHEDTASAVSYKEWVPTRLVHVTSAGVRALERWAEGRFALLLAESSYAQRFRRAHPVVPNSTLVDREAPLPGPGRVVCVSTLTRARGALDLVEVGRRLRPEGVVVDVIGPASPDVEAALREADLSGDIRWHGRLPHAQTLQRVRGATAGLSLLHDERNYRYSHPTKVFEYLAEGLPVVATPLPLVREIVEGNRAGIIVPFRDPEAAAAAVLMLHHDEDLRIELGRNGMDVVQRSHNWEDDAGAFVTAIEEAARKGNRD